MPITRADLDEIKMRARERVAEWLTNYVNQMDDPYIRATNNALAEQAQQQSTPAAPMEQPGEVVSPVVSQQAMPQISEVSNDPELA